MNIINHGSLAVLEDSGDIVCFDVHAPDPVFIPREMRPFFDRFLSEKIDESCFAEQKAFNLFAHRRGISSKSTERGKVATDDKCCKCSGQDCRRTSASIYLLLAHGCNQACIYCLNGRETYGVADSVMMKESVAKKALQQVASTITHDGDLEVVFFGGEPLLNWPLAKLLMDWVDGAMKKDFPSLNVRFHLTTNLSVFPDDLIDYARRYGITFLVSVDGPSDVHNVTRPYKSRGHGNPLADTMQHIRYLRAANIPVALRATVTSHNHDRLLEVSQFHKDCGATSSAFSPLNAVDSDGTIMPRELCPDPQKFASGLVEIYRSNLWSVEDLFPFNEYNKRFHPGYRINHGCGAPYGNTPVVTADGKLFTCIYMVNNPQFEAGTIDKGDYPREKVLAWMREVTNTNRRACRDCVFQYLCGGGCPVGLFGIQRKPESADWAKQYTREISCAMSRAVLGELLFDRGRATVDELDRQLESTGSLPLLLCDNSQSPEANKMISKETIWECIKQEAICEKAEAK